MAAAGDVTADYAGDGVTVRLPLSHAERQARYKARKKAERAAGRDEKGLFQPENLIAVTHGVRSHALTAERAQEIAARFLRSAECPGDARESPLLMSAVAAWAQAEAECERIRDYRGVLETQLGDDAVAEMMTEETQVRETEVRPPGATMTRDGLSRQRESLDRTAHRMEMRAHTLRTALQKRLEAHGTGRKTVSLARLMAEDEAAEEQPN